MFATETAQGRYRIVMSEKDCDVRKTWINRQKLVTDPSSD